MFSLFLNMSLQKCQNSYSLGVDEKRIVRKENIHSREETRLKLFTTSSAVSVSYLERESFNLGEVETRSITESCGTPAFMVNVQEVSSFTKNMIYCLYRVYPIVNITCQYS